MKCLGFGQRTDGTHAVAQIDKTVAGWHGRILQYWHQTKSKTGNPLVLWINEKQSGLDFGGKMSGFSSGWTFNKVNSWDR
jgi:hypothetical protein